MKIFIINFLQQLQKTNILLAVLLFANNNIENIFFVYLLLKEHPGSFENKFIDWCSKNRQVKKSKNKFKQFIVDNINPEKDRLFQRFNSVFYQLEESYLSRPKLKYILAKITQYIDENAYDSERDLNSYLNKVEIEHILPQNPTPEIKSNFDKPNEIESYTKKLGNLTLIAKTINSSLGNKPFEEKKKEYSKSQYLLSRSIVEKIEVGKNTAINRTTVNLQTFDEWTSESIEQRQKMLTELAKKVWEMP